MYHSGAAAAAATGRKSALQNPFVKGLDGHSWNPGQHGTLFYAVWEAFIKKDLQALLSLKKIIIQSKTNKLKKNNPTNCILI